MLERENWGKSWNRAQDFPQKISSYRLVLENASFPVFIYACFSAEGAALT